MTENPFAPKFEALPDALPIFPLEGVLLLPGGTLPLNIFEPRYLAMTEAALASSRMIGMIQPLEGKSHTGPVHKIGCAGKITEFSETDDGRYLITLTGISRYEIKEELDSISGYRQIKPAWDGFKNDLDLETCLGLDRERLRKLLRHYFEKEGMECSWKAIEDTHDNKLITCLAMACPLSGTDKQQLLEAKCCKTRANMFFKMLEVAICAEHGCAEHHH